MTLFYSNSYQHALDRLLAVFLVLSVVISLALPQKAETAVLEVKGELFVEEEVPFTENVYHFPESEARKARYTIRVIATAYSSDPRQTDATPCIPAMGTFNLCENYEKNGTEDTIATNFLPLGTQVRLPELYGDKVFTVRDRMNARYNGTTRIDIWIGSVTPTSAAVIQEAKQEAKSFGVKRLKMEVLK